MDNKTKKTWVIVQKTQKKLIVRAKCRLANRPADRVAYCVVLCSYNRLASCTSEVTIESFVTIHIHILM